MINVCIATQLTWSGFNDYSMFLARNYQWLPTISKRHPMSMSILNQMVKQKFSVCDQLIIMNRCGISSGKYISLHSREDQIPKKKPVRINFFLSSFTLSIWFWIAFIWRRKKHWERNLFLKPRNSSIIISSMHIAWDVIFLFSCIFFTQRIRYTHYNIFGIWWN